MKIRILAAVFPLLLAVAAPTRAQNLTIINHFPGDSAIGPKTLPDNVGAVGPVHVVDLTCANFVVHDKTTGKVLLQKSQVDFWKDLGFPGVVANDPRLLYDATAQRWITTTAFDQQHHLLLAVSTSSDPTQPWKGVQTPFKSPDFGFRCGVDKNGFYGCFWNFNKDTHTMMDCVAISKADLLAPAGPDLAHVQMFPGIEIEAFPATDLDPDKAPDAPEILLNREFGNSFSKLYMYKITWSGNTATISPRQEIPLSKTYVSPNGSSQKNQAVQPAPGPKLRADEARRTTCVFRAGASIFTCNAAKRTEAARCGLFWCEVKVDGTLMQEGLVDDPDCDYLIPSLAADANGNVGLGCTRTSEKEFPSVCVMARRRDDPKNTMGPPILAVPGTCIFTSSRPVKFGAVGWGNYNSTCVDPSDPTTLWTYQEYAASNVPEQFSTHWVAFKIK